LLSIDALVGGHCRPGKIGSEQSTEGVPGAAPAEADAGFRVMAERLTAEEEAKRRGNKAFQAGKYQAAIDAYTEAIVSNPKYTVRPRATA
jgi:hypothetical protein